MPYYFLPDYAVSNGLSKAKGALLLSIVGASIGVGRVGAGCISSRQWADHLKIHNVILIIGGLLTGAIPFFTSFYLLSCCTIAFGIAAGKYSGTRVYQILSCIIDKSILLTYAFTQIY